MSQVLVDIADLTEMINLTEALVQKDAAAIAAAQKKQAAAAAAPDNNLANQIKTAADRLVQHGHIAAADHAMAVTQLSKHANALQTIATLAARHPKTEMPQALGTPMPATTKKAAHESRTTKPAQVRESDQDFLARIRNG